MEDPGSVARVGREEAAEDCEMRGDLDSVQNSEVELAVPIVRDSEPSINDSVSPIISFIIYLICLTEQPTERKWRWK